MVVVVVMQVVVFVLVVVVLKMVVVAVVMVMLFTKIASFRSPHLDLALQPGLDRGGLLLRHRLSPAHSRRLLPAGGQLRTRYGSGVVCLSGVTRLAAEIGLG